MNEIKAAANLLRLVFRLIQDVEKNKGLLDDLQNLTGSVVMSDIQNKNLTLLISVLKNSNNVFTQDIITDATSRLKKLFTNIYIDTLFKSNILQTCAELTKTVNDLLLLLEKITIDEDKEILASTTVNENLLRGKVIDTATTGLAPFSLTVKMFTVNPVNGGLEISDKSAREKDILDSPQMIIRRINGCARKVFIDIKESHAVLKDYLLRLLDVYKPTDIFLSTAEELTAMIIGSETAPDTLDMINVAKVTEIINELSEYEIAVKENQGNIVLIGTLLIELSKLIGNGGYLGNRFTR